MTNRIPIIGLVGGIGSGKSALAAAFESLGCRRLDADRAGHDMLARADVYAELVTTFGNSILAPDGRIDRQRLAAVAFADDASTAALNRIVGGALWPEFRRRALEAADAAPSQAPAVVLDAALLYESETADLCDAVVFVEAPDEVRRRRLHSARGWTWEEVLRRESRQFPLSRKRALADFLCTNDADLNALRATAEQILADVRERFSSPNGQKTARRSGLGPT